MPSGRVYAEFAGQRGGTATLTWGQHGMWGAIQRNPPGHFNVPLVVTAPRRPEQTVARVAAALGELVSRHEALRTRIVPLDGEPVQQVAREGRLAVEVVHADSPQLVRPAAAGLQETLVAKAFHYPQEWPVRAGLAVHDGVVRQIVLVFCHAATDWQGAEVAARDLRALLRGDSPPAPRMQPLDLARWQATLGRDRTRRAVVYWTSVLRGMPLTMFAADGPAPYPPSHQATLTSRALDGAARVIAARHRVSTSTVLLAATVALIGSWTGHRTCALHTLVNNRFQEGHGDVVGMLAQLALLAVELPGGLTFDELVIRTWQAALLGHRHAYYDQVVLQQARAEVSRDRGAEVNAYCCFNDMRSPQDTVAGPAAALPARAAVRAALPESVLTCAAHAPLNCRFCLRVEPATGPLKVVLTADGRSLSDAEIGQFLSGLEKLVTDAAFTEVRLGDLPRAGRR